MNRSIARRSERSHSVSYSQRLDRGTELFFTWSALCQDRFILFFYVPAGRVRVASPVAEQRTWPSRVAPRPHRRHRLQGRSGSGLYTPGLPPLEGVDVILDNVVHARTDSSGRFRFDDVTFGRHRVEAHYVSGAADVLYDAVAGGRRRRCIRQVRYCPGTFQPPRCGPH